jgi:hypothetical protein
MHYEKRVICFLDILGFSEHVENTINQDGIDNEEYINNINDGFEAIRFYLDVDNPEAFGDTKATQFSDSVVISFPINEESGVFHTLLDVMFVQMNLIIYGLLCRGAITKGKLIHTEKLLFGPALINAYQLESKAALYPRVILDKDIIEIGMSAHASHHFKRHERDSIMSLLSKDTDGMYFVDYITKGQGAMDEPDDYPDYLHRLRNIIANGLEKMNPSIRIKYQWMKEKFTPHLTNIKSTANQEDFNPFLHEAYNSIPDLE